MKLDLITNKALLFYIVPVILCGEWNINRLIYFPISIIVISFLINRSSIEKGYSGWEIYAYSALHGASIATYGISIIPMTKVGDIIPVTGDWGIFVYLLSSIPFIIFASRYREERKRDYEKTFNDFNSLNRHRKINQLLG